MKKQIILSTILFAFSLPAFSQVSDTQLGNVVAVERSYRMNLQSLQANLKLETNRDVWATQVFMAEDGKDIVTNLTPKDYLVSVATMNVIFMVLPDSYKAYVSSMRGAPTKEQAEIALTKAFNELGFSDKEHSVRFLKISR